MRRFARHNLFASLTGSATYGCSRWFAIISLVFGALVACSSKSETSSQKDSKPEGNVQVQGNTKDEDNVDFKQADESVQIGGTRLTSSSSNSYSITATLIKSTGFKQIYTGVSDTANFSLNIVAAGYVRVDVTTGDRTLSAVLPPDFNTVGATKVKMTIDRTTSIAAKIMTIIGDKAAAGDAAAKLALDKWSIPVSDLYTVASSARRAVESDATVIANAPVVSLTDLATRLVSSANSKVNNLAPEMTANQYAKKVSARAENTTFGADALTVAPNVLAYRTGGNLGTSAAATSDVAYNAVAAAANRFVIGAFQTEAKVYRQAASNDLAASCESKIVTVYATVFASCQASPTTCVNAKAAIPAAPATTSSGSSSTTTTDTGEYQ